MIRSSQELSLTSNRTRPETWTGGDQLINTNKWLILLPFFFFPDRLKCLRVQKGETDGGDDDDRDARGEGPSAKQEVSPTLSISKQFPGSFPTVLPGPILPLTPNGLPLLLLSLLLLPTPLPQLLFQLFFCPNRKSFIWVFWSGTAFVFLPNCFQHLVRAHVSTSYLVRFFQNKFLNVIIIIILLVDWKIH